MCNSLYVYLSLRMTVYLSLCAPLFMCTSLYAHLSLRMTVALRMMRVYDAHDATQAVAAAHAWQELPLHAGTVRVIAREGEVRGVSTATDQVVEMHKINVTRYGEEAVLNLLLMSHCRAFVGTFSSNFGRLGYEMAYARQHGHLFGASMDVFWHAYP